MPLALVLPLAGGTQANPWADCSRMVEQPNAHAYCLALAAAEKAIAEGRWDAAIAMLEELKTRQVDENTPNYRPLLPLGIAHCGKGDRSAGIAYLSLYACALRLDYGVMSCWIDGDPAKGVRGDLTSECATLACGEAYSRPDPAELPVLRRELDAARQRCN